MKMTFADYVCSLAKVELPRNFNEEIKRRCGFYIGDISESDYTLSKVTMYGNTCYRIQFNSIGIAIEVSQENDTRQYVGHAIIINAFIGNLSYRISNTDDLLEVIDKYKRMYIVSRQSFKND